MPVQTFLDVFTVPASAVLNTTFARTGYGFAPQAALVWCSGRGESVDAVGGASSRWSMGFVTSPTARACYGGHSEDGVATSDTDGGNAVAAVIFTLLAGNAVDGMLDVSAFGADGITFIVDDQFAADLRVMVWAIGGITNVALLSATSPVVTGLVDYTVGSFQPDICFFLCRGAGASARHSFGYALSAANQAVVGYKQRDNVLTMDTARYGRAGQCLAVNAANSTSLQLQAELAQMNSDGFRLNWLTVEGSTRTFAALAIQGGDWTGGTDTTRTDATPFALSTPGITPAGLFVASHCTAQSTAGTVGTHVVYSVGAAASPSNRGAQGLSDKHATVDAEVATILEHDALYARLDLADGIAGLMDVTAMSSGQIDLLMDDPDPDAAWFWWVACGNPVAGGEERALASAVAGNTSTSTPPAALLHALLSSLAALSTTPTLQTLAARAVSTAVLGSTTTPLLASALFRALATSVSAATATPPVPAMLRRALISTLLGTTSTPAVPVSMTGQITLSTGVLGTTSTPVVPATLRHALATSLSAATATPAVPVTLRRALTSTLSAGTLTPLVAVSMTGQIALVTTVLGTTTTATPTFTTTRRLSTALLGLTTTPALGTGQWRPLATTVPGVTTTPALARQIQRRLTTTLPGTTSTPGLARTVARALQTTLVGQTSTPTPTAHRALALTTALAGSTSTPPLAPALLRALQSTSLAQTITPALAVQQVRTLSTLVPGLTVTPNVFALLSGQVFLLSQLVGVTATSTLPFSLRRALASTVIVTTQTPALASDLSLLVDIVWAETVMTDIYHAETTLTETCYAETVF